MKKSNTIFENEIYAYVLRLYCFHLPQASISFCSDSFGAYSMVTLAYNLIEKCRLIEVTDLQLILI